MLFSSIKGKQVFAISEAKYIGEVTGAYVHMSSGKAEFLILSSAPFNILPYAQVFGNGEMLTIKSTACLKNDSEIDLTKHFYFNTCVHIYSVSGEHMGISQDIDLNAKPDERLLISENGLTIPLKKVVSGGKDVMFVNENGKREFTVRRVKQGEKRQTPNGMVSETQTGGTVINTAISHSPALSSHDYSFLLGRRVEQDIGDIARTFLIRRGTVISKKTIEDARIAGKLVDLTINSLKI